MLKNMNCPVVISSDEEDDFRTKPPWVKSPSSVIVISSDSDEDIKSLPDHSYSTTFQIPSFTNHYANIFPGFRSSFCSELLTQRKKKRKRKRKKKSAQGLQAPPSRPIGKPENNSAQGSQVQSSKKKRKRKKKSARGPHMESFVAKKRKLNLPSSSPIEQCLNTAFQATLNLISESASDNRSNSSSEWLTKMNYLPPELSVKIKLKPRANIGRTNPANYGAGVQGVANQQNQFNSSGNIPIINLEGSRVPLARDERSHSKLEAMLRKPNIKVEPYTPRARTSNPKLEFGPTHKVDKPAPLNTLPTGSRQFRTERSYARAVVRAELGNSLQNASLETRRANATVKQEWAFSREHQTSQKNPEHERALHFAREESCRVNLNFSLPATSYNHNRLVNRRQEFVPMQKVNELAPRNVLPTYNRQFPTGLSYAHTSVRTELRNSLQNASLGNCCVNATVKQERVSSFDDSKECRASQKNLKGERKCSIEFEDLISTVVSSSSGANARSEVEMSEKSEHSLPLSLKSETESSLNENGAKLSSNVQCLLKSRCSQNTEDKPTCSKWLPAESTEVRADLYSSLQNVSLETCCVNPEVKQEHTLPFKDFKESLALQENSQDEHPVDFERSVDSAEPSPSDASASSKAEKTEHPLTFPLKSEPKSAPEEKDVNISRVAQCFLKFGSAQDVETAEPLAIPVDSDEDDTPYLLESDAEEKISSKCDDKEQECRIHQISEKDLPFLPFRCPTRQRLAKENNRQTFSIHPSICSVFETAFDCKYEEDTFLKEAVRQLKKLISPTCKLPSSLRKKYLDTLSEATRPSLSNEIYEILLQELRYHTFRSETIGQLWESLQNVAEKLEATETSSSPSLISYTFAIQYIICCFRAELLNRTLVSSTFNLQSSAVYRLLALKNPKQIVQWLICFVRKFRQSDGDLTEVADAKKSGDLGALCSCMQCLLSLSVTLHIRPTEHADMIVKMLRDAYWSLELWPHRSLLLSTMSSELLRYKLCELLLQKDFLQPSDLHSFQYCGPLSLEKIVSRYFFVRPRHEIRLEQGISTAFYSEVEELLSILKYLLQGYFAVTKDNLNLPLHEQVFRDKCAVNSDDLSCITEMDSHTNKLKEHVESMYPGCTDNMKIQSILWTIQHIFV